MSVNKEEKCRFCEIAAGKTDEKILYRDGTVTAFLDKDPYYKYHVLVIPNGHFESLNDVWDTAERYRVSPYIFLGELLDIAIDLAHELGIAKSGYRIVINTGEDAIQKVKHLHLHLLGGERMDYEPRNSR